MEMKQAFLAFFLVISALISNCYGQSSPSQLDKQVASLIEKMLNEKTEQQAFADLEALGCPAVPAIIERMDDYRKLPDPRISLRNKSPQAFEGLRHYGPEKVVDALAAILNQITAQHFGFIYNGATDAERKKTVQGWRDFLILHVQSYARRGDGQARFVDISPSMQFPNQENAHVSITISANNSGLQLHSAPSRISGYGPHRKQGVFRESGGRKLPHHPKHKGAKYL